MGDHKMESVWSTRFSSSSSSSRRYLSRSVDLYGHDEFDGDDELKSEFLCPFCAEDFDIVELCCHIDEEHPLEAKNGVCPVCAKRVGLDLVSHVTTQHGSLLKVQRKRRFRKGGSNLTFSILKKELREGNLQAFLGGSSFSVSSNAEADPLLSSFIYNSADQPVSTLTQSSIEANLVKETSKEEFLERRKFGCGCCYRDVKHSVLSDKDQEEKTQKSEFVRGLLMSTILGKNSKV